MYYWLHPAVTCCMAFTLKIWQIEYAVLIPFTICQAQESSTCLLVALECFSYLSASIDHDFLTESLWLEGNMMLTGQKSNV